MTAVSRFFEDVKTDEELPPVAYPLPVYRLVMAAGANRDFNSIHHNTDYARATGAPEMYANTSLLLGMWERLVRDWMGPAGTITAIRGFRMRAFNTVGDTTWVRGRVLSTETDAGPGTVDIEVYCENSAGVTVGPGTVRVTLPLREAAP
ncbi:hotdog family protein [Streptomyces spongiae]|uniref:Acyl dehydratase n=1 Tax=Streptomyces spongiae TaxID=565072 RepID=A0A5N8XDA8_9ACTN|nr:acyl dehydratase [Streptomyces spongiae]MPY56515.1 acyl dehydratase [Streptomyces spongiae]